MATASEITFNQMVDEWISESSLGSAAMMATTYELVRSRNYNDTQRRDRLVTKVTTLSEKEENEKIPSNAASSKEEEVPSASKPDQGDSLRGTFLRSVEIENFRPYYAKNVLEFSVDPDRPVTLLLSNKNGSGKTAFLNAMCWGLFGELANPNDDEPGILVNYRAVDEDPRARASVKIDIQINNLRYQITRSADREQAQNGKNDVEIICEDEEGTFIHANMTLFYKEFPEIFRRIFFLAGESINAMKMRDSGIEDLPFKRGIEVLLRTDDFDTAIKDLQNVLDHRLLKVPAGKGDKAIKNREEAVKKANTEKTKLETEITQVDAAIEDLKQEINGLTTLVAGGSGDEKEMERYQEEKDRIQKEKEIHSLHMTTLESLVKRLCDETYAHLSLPSLGAGIERIQRAQDAELIPPRFGPDILEASLASGECQLCGEKLGKEAKDRIDTIANWTKDKRTSQFATEQRNWLEGQKLRHLNNLGDLQDDMNVLAETLETLLADEPTTDWLHSSIMEARKKLTFIGHALIEDEKKFNDKFDEKKLEQGSERVALLVNRTKALTAKEDRKKKIIQELIPQADIAIKTANKEYSEAIKGNEEGVRIARARQFVLGAIEVFKKMSDGLCEKGRIDLEREMKKIFASVLPNVPFQAHIGENFQIYYTMTNGEPAGLSTAQKVLGYGSYAAGLSMIAPQYQNILDMEGVWDVAGNVSGSRVSSCPIVLDAPTTSMVKENKKMFLQKVTEILPQVVITTFVEEEDAEAWKVIKDGIGQLAMIYISGPETEESDLYWMGQSYQASSQNKDLKYIQSTIREME